MFGLTGGMMWETSHETVIYCVLPTVAALQEQYQARYQDTETTTIPHKDLCSYSVERHPNADLPPEFTANHPHGTHYKILRKLPAHLWVQLGAYLSLSDLAQLATCSKSLKRRVRKIVTLLEQRSIQVFAIPRNLFTKKTLQYMLHRLDKDMNNDFTIRTLLEFTNWVPFNQAINHCLKYKVTKSSQEFEECLKSSLHHDEPLAFLHLLFALQNSHSCVVALYPHVQFYNTLSCYLSVIDCFRKVPKRSYEKTSLGFYAQSLTMLPPILDKRIDLTELSISESMLITLPPQIGHLAELKDLQLNDNCILSLPPEIEKCTALETLGLYNNELQDWPLQIIGLTNLTYLDLSKNPCENKEIPEEFMTFLKRIKKANNAEIILSKQLKALVQSLETQKE